ncbi:hypothetical protein KBD11_00280 [Candidatus Saccharibacteria bacterium]|nr:hypothetical protein [Candidatus Saccharibacteria bacterium]
MNLLNRSALFIVVLGVGIGIASSVYAPRAFAVARLVQARSAAANRTTVSATLSPAARPKHLIVVVCAARNVVAFTTPAGFTVAKSELTTAPVQAIYYKVAVGGETTVSCAGGGNARRGIQLYEYSGTATVAPLESVNAVASTGNSANASSGTLTTTSAKALLVAGIVMQTSGTGISAWSNSFTERTDFTSTARFAGADRYTTATGNFSTVATNSAASAWRGQIAAFKLLTENLSGDIVNASNVSIVNPSVGFPTRSFDFNCQSSGSTLGTVAEQIRVVNTTANAAWTLSIGATAGITSFWSDGGTNSYDFNDPTVSGCSDGGDADTIAGQLTIDPSTATITPDTSCSNTGVTRGSSLSFSQGVTDSIPLITGSISAEINCMWNITGITLAQQIPAEPAAASYSLGLTLTLVAN